MIVKMWMILLLCAALAFAITMAVMPTIIRRLQRAGTLVRDYYKPGKVIIPTKGGVVILLVSFLTVAITAAIISIPQLELGTTLRYQIIFAEIFVIEMYGIMGILDDFIDIGRKLKLLVPFIFGFYLFTIPWLAEESSWQITLPLIAEPVHLGYIFPVILVPLYILVCSNLINMHSGFNGLQSGLSSIILITLFTKQFIQYMETGGTSVTTMLTIGAVAGAVAGFWWYNRYPAKILEGNIGALAIGAAIGVAIVVNGYLVAGFVMLIPHTVNFLMYMYWRVKRRMLKRQGRELGEYHKSIKFGRVREDGTIEVPNRLTLKWLLPYHYRMTENQAVYAMYALTGAFCIISLFIPY